MRRLLFAVVGLCSILATACVETESSTIDQSAYPEFSWDRVPVALHFGKLNDDFTPEEVEFMAQFPLICIEKHQAYEKYHDVRKGAYVAAEALKRENPATTVLFYWNSRIDYGMRYFDYYMLDEDHHPEWAMRDINDELVIAHGQYFTYDATNPDFRKWWISIPVEAMKSCEYLDGVFIDALPQHLRNREIAEKNWGVEKVAGIRSGVDAMLKGLNEQIGDDKVIFANNTHAISDFETGVHRHIDGGMIEHFCDFPHYTLEFMASQIEIVQDAARRGRMTMVKCWPRHCFLYPETYEGLSQEQLEQDSKDDIEYPLACFLIAAGKYSYFCYSWGYNEHQGGMIDYPEYSYPLGEPEGEAVRDGWKYSRRFEHAYVTIDLETRTGNIEWL